MNRRIDECLVGVDSRVDLRTMSPNLSELTSASTGLSVGQTKAPALLLSVQAIP
jgi:hypothetical protein